MEVRETTYRVTFTRVGRHHPPPLEVRLGPAGGDCPPDVLAERIYRHVRALLASRGVEVAVGMDDPGHGRGTISAGWRDAGSFTIEAVPAAPAAGDHRDHPGAHPA